ncbi:MAG TPA: MlaD family protein [Solirubrobacteraceae bacterium]
MKRVVVASLVVVAMAATAGFIANPPNTSGPKAQYWVELDNGFGLIEGGDLKIAGARAGTITDLKLDKRTLHAKVGFRVTQNGFGDLRTDTTCETRPQSLIGEYFLDCDPGTARKRLAKSAVIPVSHTSSTVPPDLVGDIMRRPQRERLSIIVSTLGAGVGGNSAQLNAAIRRASPALRETDRVLAILAQQNKVIRDLNQHADAVVGELARSRREVVDWVEKSRDISRDSAQRAADISAGWRKLPAFLAELRPAMAALGRTAETQGPALRTLGANADQLKRLFNNLAPFSDASRPAFAALGKASDTGSQAVKAATPTVAQLNRFASGAPELGRNLAIVLEHLDDRGAAIEHDKRAAKQQGVAEPSGYSGLEALLQYVFDQATSTNMYDQADHILAVQAFHESACAPYRDAINLDKMDKDAKAALLEQCQAKLGPNSPGVDTPDPSAGDAPPREITYEEPVGPTPAANERTRDQRQAVVAPSVPQPAQEEHRQVETPKPDVPKPDVPKPPVHVPDPGDVVPHLPPPPTLPAPPPLPDAGKALPPVDTNHRSDGKGGLLDYLLGS